MYRKNRKILTFLQIHLNQTHPEFKEYDQAATPVNSRISPANPGTTGSQAEPGSGAKTIEKIPSVQTERCNKGDRLKGAGAKLESFTRSDLLGNASFSSAKV